MLITFKKLFYSCLCNINGDLCNCSTGALMLQVREKHNVYLINTSSHSCKLRSFQISLYQQLLNVVFLLLQCFLSNKQTQQIANKARL